MQVNGYFSTPVAPAAPAMPMAPAAPVMRTAASTATAGVPGDSLDMSLQQLYSTVITPITAGAAPGIRAARGVGEARMHFLRASTAKSARTQISAAASGRSAIFGGVWSAVKFSVLLKGATSLAMNAYRVYTGRETMADGGANVAGDLVSSVVGGAAAGVASGLGTYLLSGLFGTGMLLTVAGAVIGCAGFFVADGLLRQTTLYNQLKAKVHAALS